MDEMHASPVNDHLPAKLTVSFGRHGGDRCEVRWDGSMLVFIRRSSLNELRSLERIVPKPSDWTRFWTWLERHDGWSWPEVCTGRAASAEGVHWNLVVEHGGRRLVSGGSNACPLVGEMDPGEVLASFLAELDLLLGGAEISRV